MSLHASIAAIDGAARSAGSTDASVLLRLFLIALVLVSPFGVRQFRRVRAGRLAGAGNVGSITESAGGSDGGSDGEAEQDPDDLSGAINRISASAALPADDPERSFVITVTERTHVDGNRLPLDMVAALVTDSAQRARIPLLAMSTPDDALARWRVG